MPEMGLTSLGKSPYAGDRWEKGRNYMIDAVLNTRTPAELALKNN